MSHVAVWALLGACLSGCVGFDPPIGGAAIKGDGNELEIAVCVTVEDAVGIVRYRDLTVANEWIDAWTFDADEDLEAGTILSTDTGVTPPFVGEHREIIPLAPGTEIQVLVTPQSGFGEVFAGFVVPDDELSEGAWLQQDRSTTERPCP